MPSNRALPLLVLVLSTLTGVACGALMGADLHLDVTIPAHAVVLQGDAARATPVSRAAQSNPGRHRTRTTAAGIEQLSAQRYRLDGSVLTRIASTDASMGRALLHRDADGEFDGYRLSSIRSGTPPHQMGLKNGDIVHAVAGIPMDSMESALRANRAVAEADVVTVDLTRRGERMTLTYELR